MDEQQVCREIISLFFSGNFPDIGQARIEVCRKYKLRTVPKNSLLLSYALPEERELLRLVLQVKPTRTLVRCSAHRGDDIAFTLPTR